MKCHIEHSNYIYTTQFETLTPLDELAGVRLPHVTQQKKQQSGVSCIDFQLLLSNKQMSLWIRGERAGEEKKTWRQKSAQFFEMP